MSIDVNLLLLAAGFVLQAIGLAVVGTWQLSRVETALRVEITKSKDEIEERQDTHLRHTGETISALRQKINDVQLESAQTYMRRDGFYQVQQQIVADMKELGKKIDERFDKLNERIDDIKNGVT